MAVLGTKVHVPVLRPDLVSRPRLLSRLDTGQPPRLLLVSAPAGFGKTTVLGQGLRAISGVDGHVAWLSLDEDDNDPRRFLEHLVAAFQTVGDFSEAAQLVETAAHRVEAVLTSLVNDLDLQPGRTVLALDDYHVIVAPEVHQAVAFLLEHLPPQAGVAIATRADPPLPLSRLRARGELVELRAHDLRFSPDEANAFLADVMGLHLSSEQVAALGARTEGWVAGLQLAALSLRGVDDTAGFVDAFTGSHRFILDYLVDEVLQHQPEPVRRFLLETAVLHQLSGPLCDALTGGSEGRAQLEALDRANVFIVALDDHRHWYRYHHLFADALRARLAAQDPHRVAELHRAASDWYAAHDMNAEAVGHALSGADPAHAADLVESVLPDLRRERRDVQLRDWLIALPAEVVRDRPLLGAYLASARMLSGDLAGVEAALVDAETALARNPPVAAAGASDATVEELRTLPATMAIFRASAAQARGDTGATQQHARKALELCGPNDHMARGGALGFLGLAAWARGDLIEAVDTFSEAVLSMGQAGDVTDQLGSTVPLADMWAARGRPDEARRLLERALAAAQDHPGAALASLGDLHVGVADVLVEQGELVAAAERLEAATVVGESASLLENRYRWYVAMARLRRAQDDIDGAVELLDKAHQVHLPGFFPEVRPIHAQKAQLRITQGRLGEAAQWATDHQVAQIDDPSYLEEFGQLTLVRLLLAQHRADADSSRLDEVALRLERLVPGATSGGRGGSLLEIQILRALMHQAHGAPAEAAAELGAALRTGAAAGYLRLFVDEGAPMQELLHAVEPPPDARRYADTLRQVATRAPAVPGRVIGAEGLSEREVEVLRLLATARSGPDIARELFVSVNTLRTHTKHIFTKLEVNTRRAAVSRATDLGLL